MRRFILFALFAGLSAPLLAQTPQFKFTITVQEGDTTPVAINVAVPPGTSHKMQATKNLRLEIEAPATTDRSALSVVRLIDESSSQPVELFTARRAAPVTVEHTLHYTVCSGRVIFQGSSPPRPASCASLPPMAAVDPIIDPDCGDCTGPYEGLPTKLSSRARIAPEDEPGEPLVVTGQVLGADGKPRSGIIVYAYHTDRNGIYPPPNPPRSVASDFHGRLRGWAMSDAQGRYTFETIRPAGYPSSVDPQHIHMHVIEPGCATYFIDELVFSDDPRFKQLPDNYRSNITRGRGGSGVTTPRRVGKTWQVVRDIHLGKNIPNYRQCTPDSGAGTR